MSYNTIIARIGVKCIFAGTGKGVRLLPEAIMNQSQKAKWIICACILLVVLSSGISVYRHLRPSRGLPYEKVTMEQAQAYMEYEKDYYLVDISDEKTYQEGHIPGALCIPYDSLLGQAAGMLPDKTAIVYICGNSAKKCDKACRKLCELGYTGVTFLGLVKKWPGELERKK